jgi:hypothetical protein
LKKNTPKSKVQGWREEEEHVKEHVRRSVNPIPNPDPNPKQAPQMSLKEAYP